MKKIAALLTLAFIVVGCTYNPAQVFKTPDAMPLPTQASAVMPTLNPSTPLPLTLTATPRPLITATKHPTREITPTTTPQPTLDRVEAERIVQQYLRDNRGCKLPCWWGITPGVTTRDAVKTFLEPMGRIEESSQDEELWFGYQLLNQPEGARVESTTFFKQGKVWYIFVFSNGTSQSYKLSQLLSSYGKPDEVNLQVYREVPDGRLPFDLYLIYRGQGIIARYKADTKGDGKNLKGCFTYGPDLWLLDAKDPDLSDLKFSYGGFAGVTKGPGSPPLLSIDQAVGMDIEAFYQKYKEPGNNCIYTPETLWPNLEQIGATATAIASRSKTVEPASTP